MEVLLKKNVDNISIDCNVENNIECINKYIILLSYLIKYRHRDSDEEKLK